METEDRIREAAEAGEVLRVIYAGGSQPGARREIAPISIQNGKVRARCFSSNAVKTFVIDKIEVVEGNQATTAVEWNAGAMPSVNYSADAHLKHPRDTSHLRRIRKTFVA